MKYVLQSMVLILCSFFFTSYVDAICKLTEEGVDIKALTSLIAGGAFDEFGLSRYSMALNLSRVIQYANSTNGLNLFGGDDTPIVENVADDMMVLASKEKEVLGFYFKFDPIERVKQKYHISVPSISEMKMGNACGFGQIVRIKQIRTKKGQRMCFVDVNDESASISLAVMPNIYDQYIEGLNKAHYVYFEGKKERESSLLVRKMVLY